MSEKNFVPNESSKIPSDDFEIRKKRKNNLRTITIILVIIGLILTGASFAFNFFNSSNGLSKFFSSQDLMVYVQSNTNPNLNQKLAFNNFLSKIPKSEFKNTYGNLENYYPTIFKNFEASGNNYQWIGSQVALAFYAEKQGGTNSDPVYAFVFDSKDNNIGKSELSKLTESEKFNPNKEVFSIVELDSNHLGLTNSSNPDKVFKGNTTLSQFSAYKTTAESYETNAFSYWVDLSKISAFLKTLMVEENNLDWKGLSTVDYSGYNYGTISASFDSVDFLSESKSIQINGKDLTDFGNSRSNAQETNNISFANSDVTLGFSGFAESLIEKISVLDPSGEISKSFEQQYGVPLKDLKKVLGDQISFSTKTDSDDKYSFYLKISGIDSEAFSKVLDSKDSTKGEYLKRLQSIYTNVKMVNKNGVFILSFGDEPEGKGNLPEGKTIGDINLSKLIYNYNLLFENVNETELNSQNWGRIVFTNDSNSGTGTLKVSWKL